LSEIVKKKIIFFGSCQIEAISKLLNKILKLENSKVIINWQYMIIDKDLPEELFDCDIFIYQPYSGPKINYHTDLIISKLKKNVKTISIPFLSFGGYWPDSVTDIRNNLTKSDKLIYGLFPQQSFELSKYLTIEEAFEKFDKNFISSNKIKEHIQICFEKIQQVEEKCDIKILNYMKDNYKTQQIFYTIQHPCNNLLIYITVKLYEILIGNVPLDYLNYFKNIPEMLFVHTVMILPYVKKELDLKFSSKNKIFGKGLVSDKEYVQIYFENINCKQLGMNFWTQK
jgi:hypothetical protein